MQWKLIGKIIFSISVFLIIYCIYNGILAAILFCNGFYQHEPWTMLFLMLLNDSSLHEPSTEALLILFVKTVLNYISIALLGSYIFAILINREANVVLSNYLVIRYSPQDAISNCKIRLGVLVGNKTGKNLYNTSCGLTCVCHKNSTADEDRPALTTDCKDVSLHILEQIYRFPFFLEDIPNEFWQNHFDNGNLEQKYPKDRIKVVFTGQTGFIGGKFTIVKEYDHNHILVCNVAPGNTYILPCPKGFLHYMKIKCRCSLGTLSMHKRKEGFYIDWDKFINFPYSNETWMPINNRNYHLQTASDLDTSLFLALQKKFSSVAKESS